jgi:NADH-quinone oxidoreductase subunit N
LLLALSVLSLAGNPPLPGFLAKLLVFKSVIASGHLAVAILAFAGSYIGVVYYLGIVLRLFAVDCRTAVDDELEPNGYSMDGVLLWSAFAMQFIFIPGVYQRLLSFL